MDVRIASDGLSLLLRFCSASFCGQLIASDGWLMLKGPRKQRRLVQNPRSCKGVIIWIDLAAIAKPPGSYRSHGSRAEAAKRFPDNIAWVAGGSDDTLEKTERLLVGVQTLCMAIFEALVSPNGRLRPNICDPMRVVPLCAHVFPLLSSQWRYAVEGKIRPIGWLAMCASVSGYPFHHIRWWEIPE